jgi:enolase-phosphatase E1
LKQLQGFVWEEGYRRGELRAPLYPDARARLSSWHRAGVPLVVYSSGSEHAQRLFFQHSSAGDIRSWFAGYQDTTIGSKHDERSYRAIARRLGKAPATFLFISDSLAELDAAQAAGMRTRWVARAEETDPTRARARERSPSQGLCNRHPAVSQLLDIAL